MLCGSFICSFENRKIPGTMIHRGGHVSILLNTCNGVNDCGNTVRVTIRIPINHDYITTLSHLTKPSTKLPTSFYLLKDMDEEICPANVTNCEFSPQTMIASKKVCDEECDCEFCEDESQCNPEVCNSKFFYKI